MKMHLNIKFSPFSSPHLLMKPPTSPPLIRLCPPPSATAQAYRSGASLYEVLRIPVGASIQEIKSAYRRLARICHPDVAATGSSPDDFIKIHAAYSTLSDPDKRALYDRRAHPLTSAASGYTRRRNWETDQCW